MEENSGITKILKEIDKIIKYATYSGRQSSKSTLHTKTSIIYTIK